MTTIPCPACGADNRAGVKFCEHCGAPLERACPSCGARLPAATRFCGECGAPVAAAHPVTGAIAVARFADPQAYTPPHLAERILKDRAALTGERKQVTVLFADVSSFTSISERLDPEDVHALINGAFEVMLAEVHRYEGTVNQFLGDGLMALFGAPVAHEDHALRAAYAALAMQHALTVYRDQLTRTRGIDFRVRMGLNSGLVVVGAIGDNLRMDYTAVGDTTNTAARMQQLAEPGQIVVAEATERLVAPYFELRQLGTFAVKNRAQPVTSWELLRPRPATSRLEARVARGRSPFVGRDDALATLERAWAAARGGRGQVVFVVGDPGIGKSRLLAEFAGRVGDAVRWVQGDCISFGQSTPFLPMISVLKRVFAIGDDDAAAIIAKVRHGVSDLGEGARTVEPYLRYLLSVDPGDPAVATMDASQRRARIVTAVERLFAAESRRRPVVLVVEDAHWIDAASEDLLKALSDSLPGMALLLIVTYRPLYEQPFGDRTYYWRIALQPVDATAAVRIVRATLGVDDLPAGLTDVIAAKAEGNPFFLEEIGRTLVETGAVRIEGGRLILPRNTATVTVPDTVQDVIAARIDRLDESQKRTVQTAAVIGREFALGLLRRVSDLHDRVEQALSDLKRMELIYEKAASADREYVFRHALTQDVAYASLLQAERRRLHALIGRAVEDAYAGRLDERVEELVHHFQQGEVWDKVARYARDAGNRAAGFFVDAKAVEFYDLALAALTRLPETPDTVRVGIEIRLAMRAPLWRGGHPERLFAIFKEAEALATRSGDMRTLDTVYAFLVQYHWARGEHESALEYGRRCLERAETRDDLGLRITGLFYMQHSQHSVGKYRESLRLAHEIIVALEGPRTLERFGLSGLPYAGACALAAESLGESGDHEGAVQLIEQGRRAADAADHLYSQMVLAVAHGDVLVEAGRIGEAIAKLEPALATCRERKFVGQLINALKHLGRAYTAAGRPAEAVPLLEESIALQETASVYVQRVLKYTSLAEAHLALGDLDRAQGDIERALQFAARTGERSWEGWAHLAAADLAHRRGDRTAAEAEIDAARDIAEELGMMPLLERCRMGLPRSR